MHKGVKELESLSVVKILLFLGTKLITAESVYCVCRQIKYGNRILSCSISNSALAYKCVNSHLKSIIKFQCRRKLRGSIQIQRANIPEWRSAMGTASYLSKFLHYRRYLFSIRSANLYHEVRFVDIQRRSGFVGTVQQ